MFKKFSQLGRAFMLPIAILPVAGLLLGLGGALTNDAAIAQFPALNQAWLQTVLQVMNAAGGAVFEFLPLIFTVGIAVGVAEADKGTAGLAGVVSYLVFKASLDKLAVLVIDSEAVIDTGVVGAIVIGGMVAYLHNRYRKISLPQFLGFFGGSRFIPIVSSLVSILIASLFLLIWPLFQQALIQLGIWISQLGVFGTFLYGFFLRLTGAVGLHHTIYPVFWYTELGGVAEVAGQQIAGAQNIFFAELADPHHVGLFTTGTKFFAGRFATMIFGLPAAALAMLHSLPKKSRKENKGLYYSGALTSMLTGITEPLEFSFLFVAPWLYVVHALLDGLSFMVADLLNIRIGNSFSGGIIDYLLFGVFQGNDSTNWIRVIPVGIVWAVIYYIVFRFCISKFNVMIPGKEEMVTKKKPLKSSGGSKLEDEALELISALGNKENIQFVGACATRLRVAVKDTTLVDNNRIKALGASGVFDVSGGIQAVFGGKADLLSQEINDQLDIEE